ncbi:MAG TPA: flagellar basal body rod C-terminal domain-containing protein [Acidimicrobiia bacterium]|nr:flagellar basal body rod C-terminal domain-containing protein [Acidimicrobiia bacterium]
MSIFPVLHTAGSGLRVDRVWMDSVADNIANINTIKPYDQPAFQARYVVAQSVRSDDNDPPGVGGGAVVKEIQYGDAEGRLRYEPDHPFANEEGIVRYPDIDLGTQMTSLIQAQRAYELNLAVVDRARDSYLQALQLNGR